MKKFISTFVKENKFITAIIIFWIIVIIIFLVVFIKNHGHFPTNFGPKTFPPGYVAPLSEHQLEAVMSQPDENATSVNVSDSELQNSMTKKDPHPPKAVQISQDEQLRLMRGQ